MISANLASVRLEGTEARIRGVLKDLNGRATMVIRGGGKVLYVGIPSNELGWLDKIAKDVGCTKHELPSLPEHEKALCGVLTVSRRYHEGRCKACTRVRSEMAPVRKEPSKPQPKKAATIGKVEPGQNFDLNGVIVSIEITRDRLFEQLESLENLLTNLKGYREAKDKLAELEQEAKDRMSAARVLLDDCKF